MNALAPGARIHLIGVCGTAMAGLAGLLRARGYRITGSDEGVYPPMSTYLESLGIHADSGFDARHLEPEPDLVVIGNAIRRGNPEVERVLDRRLPFISLPALVSALLLPGKKVAVVAGTHGKTTTSSMLAHILEACGEDPSFLIGGIPIGAGAPARSGKGASYVLEGDEYDTAFFDKGPKLMHYIPDVAILNAVEMDHADIYKDLDTVRLQFRRWVNIIPGGSLLLVHGDDADAVAVTANALCRVERFGEGAANEWQIVGIEEDAAGARFALAPPERFALAPTARVDTLAAASEARIGAGRQAERHGRGASSGGPDAPDRSGALTSRPTLPVQVPTAGAFNARNAVAAIAAAAELGVPLERAVAAMAAFPGVRRRLEVRGLARGVTVVDDFAHHPTAIRETIRASRAKWPQGRVIAIVEPRSWSLRRNLFQDDLPDALAGADAVVVAAVYHGDMLADSERLDVPRLVREVAARGVSARHCPDAAAIVGSLVPELRDGDVLLVMSNGGFGGIHEKFLSALGG